MTPLDDVQAQFHDSVRRYLATDGLAATASPREAWRAVADLGWIGAVVPEAQGGFGGDVEALLVAREVGEALAPLPYAASAVLPAAFLGSLAGRSFASVALDAVMEGQVLVSAAPLLPASASGVDLRLAADVAKGVAGRIDGLRDVAADVLFLPAVRSRDGRTVLVALDGAAVRAAGAAFPTIDGGDVIKADIGGAGLKPLAVCEDDAGLAAFERATQLALLAQCAEMVGGMTRMFDLTRDYLLVRRQFDKTLAEFQALRHRLADMFAELELSKAMLQAGLAGLRAQSADERSRVVSACRLKVGLAARYVSAQAIQLHGGIGLTEEYALGAYYRRCLVLRKTWGDEDFHALRVDRFHLAEGAAPQGLKERAA